jgi:hypothetical protein
MLVPQGVTPSPTRERISRLNRPVCDVLHSSVDAAGMSGCGPSRHLLRCSDTSGVGGQADIAPTSRTDARLPRRCILTARNDLRFRPECVAKVAGRAVDHQYRARIESEGADIFESIFRIVG